MKNKDCHKPMLLKDYAPFFREGQLFLPDTTIQLLIESGLDSEIAQSATDGLRLDDDRRNIGLISNHLEKALAYLTHQSHIHDQLSSHETKFMLSDMDEDEISGET
jgi:hypothetical protein